jgi:hypothetical protein
VPSPIPRLSVRVTGVDPAAEPGRLGVAWQVTNLSDSAVDVLETWLPHGRFFAERETLVPPITLVAGTSATIRRIVRYSAEPGEVVENAFLNLRVRAGGGGWLMLARMHVSHAAGGGIDIEMESVTTQPVGFSHGVWRTSGPPARQ